MNGSLIHEHALRSAKGDETERAGFDTWDYLIKSPLLGIWPINIYLTFLPFLTSHSLLEDKLPNDNIHGIVL